MKNDYTYAVARIRVREQELLDRAFLEQLLSAPAPEEILRRLADRGWGDGETRDPREMLACEERKTWALMEELLADPSVLCPLKWKTDCQNLKAAIKLSCTETSLPPERFFCQGGTVDPELLLRCARERDYSPLPEAMASAGEEAGRILLHTGDGQLCDLAVDRAWLEALYRAGQRSEEALHLYSVHTAVSADIRTAVRAGRTGKSLDFMGRALVPVKELDTEGLARAALEGTEQTADFLERTEFAGAAPALRESDAAFERWSAGRLMELLRPQRARSFTVGPLIAYILAREQEIRSVGLILSGKQNQLPEDRIRERLGEMYV